MTHRICSYSSATATALICSLLLFLIIPTVEAQQPHPSPTPKRDQKREIQPDTIPLFNGAYIGVDLLGVGNGLLGSDFLSAEVSLVANLKNKFLPTLELGYGSTNAWNETGTHYKSSAPYFRLGVDYNTMSKKKEKNSYLFVGVRYGLSSFTYDVSSLPMDDPIWGDALPNPGLDDGIWNGESVPFDQKNLKATIHWFELVAGIQAQIYKNFHMGWTVRMKYKMSSAKNEYADPWYVPGYGKYKSNSIGITYSFIYKLPIRAK